MVSGGSPMRSFQVLWSQVRAIRHGNILPSRHAQRQGITAPPILPILLLSTLLWLLLSPESAFARARASSCPAASDPGKLSGEHYSPDENLERIDVALIDRARHRIDIAMYAFTDRPIADALIRAAGRGVTIRIYRDRIQVRDRGDKTRRLLASSAGNRFTVLIKHNSFRNIMHLKAYAIDGRWLRTGSANWSPPGEGAYCTRHRRTRWNQQDNNLFITENRREIARFERTFDALFSRAGGRHGNIPWTPEAGRHHRTRRRD